MGRFANQRCLMYYEGVIKILPIIFLLILISGGLIYFRFFATKPDKNSLTSAQIANTQQGPLEVPKTSPGATIEDRVKTLEEALINVVKKLNSLNPQQTTDSSLDQRLKDVEASVTELKARVLSLENATPAPTAISGRSTVYIPLGSGGSGGDKGWVSNGNYGATIDPAEYPGYSSMQFEVNFRLTQKIGTAYARLFNVTDNSVTSGEVSTTSDNFSWQTSSYFTLPNGKKTYTVQFKSTDGTDAQFQSARIKVNF